jgi:DNA processing protein
MSELATAVFAARTDAHLLDEPRSTRFASFRRTFDEPAFLRDLAELGYRWLARSDPAFPARLRSIHDPPPGLFIRGAASVALLDRPSVALVGARACSHYGASVAASLARELADAGVVVVSGLARGVDGAAHRGALKAGTTVAVLGCGIDRDYPRTHAPLAAAIACEGLIVSEYAPGVEPAPWRFPARNRIVAGLTLATVVVEARERSGALITADLALDEGREVLAVPGEITSQLSRGTNHLLRLGAVPVTSAADVLRVLGVDPPPAREPHALEPRLELVRAAVGDA